MFLLSAVLLMAMTACENPAKSRIYTDEGSKLLLRYSKYDEAEETLTKAIKYDKGNYEAYYYRGCTKFNRSMYDEAILDFEKALEIKPNYADAEFNLGKIYFMKNDFDMSCFYYKSAELHGRPNMDDYLKSCPD